MALTAIKRFLLKNGQPIILMVFEHLLQRNVQILCGLARKYVSQMRPT
jgi:hypothetical protein